MICHDSYEYWLEKLIRLLNVRLSMRGGHDTVIEEAIRDAKGLLRYSKLLRNLAQTDKRLLDFMCRSSLLTQKVDDLLKAWDAG